MRVVALSAASLLLGVEAAFAASGEGAHHGPSWSLTLWACVNFATYLWILRRFAWPLVREYLQGRRDTVLKALEAAQRAKADAERLKSDFELRMRTLESEAANAREEILALAQLDAKRAVEQAEQTAEIIRRDARLVADQEVARARQLLRDEAVEQVTRLAAALISKELGAEDQERFVREFLAETREAVQ
jgi:F-type H+-transporting ATPase subunit b